jgi:hypothetical protein
VNSVVMSVPVEAKRAVFVNFITVSRKSLGILHNRDAPTKWNGAATIQLVQNPLRGTESLICAISVGNVKVVLLCSNYSCTAFCC